MPLSEGGPCAACGSATTQGSAWYGQAGGPRYCHRRPCQRVGVGAGDIRRRPKAALDRARADEDAGRFTEGMELLELKEIISSRIYKDGALQGTAASRSKVSAASRALHYLVFGEFKLTEEDEGGRAYYWMDINQLRECNNLDEEELDEARQAYREAEDALAE